MSRLRTYTPMRRTRRRPGDAVAKYNPALRAGRWPRCPGCGNHVLGGHLTCGAVECEPAVERLLAGPSLALRLEVQPPRVRGARLDERDPDSSTAYRLVRLRSGGRCEVVLDGVRCRRGAVEQHHTRKPRQSFDGPEHRIDICRPCHDRAEYPYRRGRLAITPRGDGTFACAIVTAPDKFTYRQGLT